MVDFVVLMPLGPTLMTDLSIGPAKFATLISSYNFAAALSGLALGFFSDRFDRKRLLMFALLGFITGTFCCSFSSSYNGLTFFRLITGVFGGLMNGVIFALIADLVPFERRGKAMGIVMSSFSVASVVGVPLGMAIADNSHWSRTFLFIGVFSVFIFLYALKTFPNIEVKKRNLEQSYFDAILGIVCRGDYLRSFGFIFLVSGSLFLLIPFLSPYAVKNMLIETTDLKYMYLVGGLFTVVTARIIGVLTDRYSALRVYIGVILLSFIPIFLFTHSGPRSLISYLILGSCFMTMVSGRMIPCMTLFSAVPSEEDRGFFMSILNSVRSLGSASMTFIGGFFIIEVSDGTLSGFGNMGVAAIVMGVLTLFIAYRINRSIQPS
jgi:DHA1 family inner membrane transport protein